MFKKRTKQKHFSDWKISNQLLWNDWIIQNCTETICTVPIWCTLKTISLCTGSLIPTALDCWFPTGQKLYKTKSWTWDNLNWQQKKKMARSEAMRRWYVHTAWSLAIPLVVWYNTGTCWRDIVIRFLVSMLSGGAIND